MIGLPKTRPARLSDQSESIIQYLDQSEVKSRPVVSVCFTIVAWQLHFLLSVTNISQHPSDLIDAVQIYFIGKNISSVSNQNIFKLPRGTLQEDIEEHKDGDLLITFVIIVTDDIRRRLRNNFNNIFPPVIPQLFSFILMWWRFVYLWLTERRRNKWKWGRRKDGRTDTGHTAGGGTRSQDTRPPPS